MWTQTHGRIAFSISPSFLWSSWILEQPFYLGASLVRSQAIYFIDSWWSFSSDSKGIIQMLCFHDATGISGQFPSEYVTAVVSGQALGGVFTAIIEIMTITFASDARGSALIFFTIGNVLLVLSVLAYILMTRVVFFRYYTSEKSVQKTNFSRLQRQPSIREPIFREVLNKIWLYGFTEWLVFAVTLSVYPSVTGKYFRNELSADLMQFHFILMGGRFFFQFW